MLGFMLLYLHLPVFYTYGYLWLHWVYLKVTYLVPSLLLPLSPPMVGRDRWTYPKVTNKLLPSVYPLVYPPVCLGTTSDYHKGHAHEWSTQGGAGDPFPPPPLPARPKPPKCPALGALMAALLLTSCFSSPPMSSPKDIEPPSSNTKPAPWGPRA